MAITVKIKNKSNHRLPEYETIDSAGMDLKANISEPISIDSLERALIPTGIFIEMPKGVEADIRPRSGLALKYGITVLNSPGTIDSDYRGEIKVILVNLSKDKFIVKPGDRVAQMVFLKHEHVIFAEVNEFTDTDRGEGGFGHSGRN